MDDDSVLERNLWRPAGRGSGGDDDNIGGNFETALCFTHNQRMLVGERRFTFDKINPISFQLVEDDLLFVDST